MAPKCLCKILFINQHSISILWNFTRLYFTWGFSERGQNTIFTLHLISFLKKKITATHLSITFINPQVILLFIHSFKAIHLQSMVLPKSGDTKNDRITISALTVLLVMTKTDLNKTLAIHDNRKEEECTQKGHPHSRKSILDGSPPKMKPGKEKTKVKVGVSPQESRVQSKCNRRVLRGVSAKGRKGQRMENLLCIATEFNLMLKTENHWSVLSEWHVYICMKENQCVPWRVLWREWDSNEKVKEPALRLILSGEGQDNNRWLPQIVYIVFWILYLLL